MSDAVPELAGKVAIVVSGAGAIGAGIARGLTERGAEVVTAEAAIQSGAPRDAETVVAHCLAKYGRVDILVLVVADAAVPSAPRSAAETDDAGAWDDAYARDVVAMDGWLAAVSPGMVVRGYGKVLSVLSIAGRRADIGGEAEGAAMAAAINLSQAWALRLAPHAVNVNAICLGAGEGAACEDAVGPAAFLVSDRSRSITGQTLNVCGTLQMN
ncbi:MAG: SDR family NAD(P)-dependent oxidoreductase [Alphaproteobacteria bacterium]